MTTRQRLAKGPVPEEPGERLAGLLDHLGRLLAEEYVAILTTTETNDTGQENPE